MTLDPTAGEAFPRELTALMPRMRAFARGLCRDTAAGDDLAQEGLARAWAARANYAPGTNMKAWVFMILRNQFYSDQRRAWRQRPLDQAMAEELPAVSHVSATLELDEVRRAMSLLPPEQRQALTLIGVGGCSYEEVALITGCAVGTIKSRVCRARDRLALIFAEGVLPKDRMRPSQAMAEILSQFDKLKPRVVPVAVVPMALAA